MTDSVGRSWEAVQPVRDVGSEEADVREVTVHELNRHTSDVIAAIRDGERTVLTRYGVPVAVVLSIADALELSRWSESAPPVRTNLELRGQLRDALRSVVGCELERRVWASELGRYLHGRWVR